MRGHWVRMVCAVGLMGCLVSGCSGQADGGGRPQGPVRTSPTAPTSAVTSTTRTAASATSATPPPVFSLPAAARAHTEEGAQAFASYYTVQMDEALHHADSSILRALSTNSCTGCRVGIDLANQLKAKGQHNSTTSFRIAGTRLSELTTDTQSVVDVLVDDKGAVTVDQAGTQVHKSAPAKFTLRQTLKWHGAGWLVAQSALL